MQIGVELVCRDASLSYRTTESRKWFDRFEQGKPRVAASKSGRDRLGPFDDKAVRYLYSGRSVLLAENLGVSQ